MENIEEPTINYDFSTLCLGPPTTVPGGSYFTRIMHNNNKPLYIQTPKCITRQGFVKSGKRMYADLMFDNNDSIFIEWIEKLETKCQDLVYLKGDNWFQTKLEKDDIETSFTSPLKIYKSGKYYLLRVNVKPNIKIYNESDKIVNVEEITSETTLISILEIQGIKFTSRNFQIELELKQSLVVSPDPFLDSCFIKRPSRSSETNTKPSETETKPKPLETNTKPLETNTKPLEKEQKTDISVLTEIPSNTITTNTNTKSTNDLEDLTNLTIELDEPSFDSKTIANTLANSLTANQKTNSVSLETKPTLETIFKSNDSNELSEVNISLDIEELIEPPKNNTTELLTEVDLTATLENSLESITLKKPNQVYYEIYQKAREKAKAAKKEAMLAYLEAKNIKKTYMLDDIDESDSELDSNSGSETESDSDSETD